MAEKDISIKTGLSLSDLRTWDMTLLNRYKPHYHMVNKACSLCALGPCDLMNGRRGACGQDLETFIAREALILAVTGAAAHAAHARDVVTRLIEAHGADLALDLGEWVNILMPITEIVYGSRPGHLKDLLPVLGYIESQIVRLLASTHFGGESSSLDLESKIFHAGTMDILSMEIAEVAQISGYKFPKGDAETPMATIGRHGISGNKPVILCIGHHSDVGLRVMDKVDKTCLDHDIEVAALCCTAHDMARGMSGMSSFTIIGNIREQLSFTRSGRADIVVADQQCIRHDLLAETLKTGAFFISTSDQTSAGLPDETDMDIQELATVLIDRPVRGVFISDPEKAAELAVAIAKRYGKIAKPSNGNENSLWRSTLTCNNCGLCTRYCPVSLPVSDAVFTAQKSIRDSDNTGSEMPASAVKTFDGIYDKCLLCGRCDSACPGQIPVMSLIESSYKTNDKRAERMMRIGRGPIDDYEIKSTGPSIVLGDIPGVVAFLTCPEYPDGREAVSWMADTLAQNGYIVLAAGCTAMDMATGDNNVYLKFPGTFDMGSIINTGSCVSSSHAIGALIKIASIFLHRRLDRNHEEIADYILNRIGATGVLWGGITPKSFSASAGANRLGIPVIFGPQGKKFRRTLEGNPDADGVFDSRTGRKMQSGLMPPHLSVVANTKEEALVEIVRLCIRPNDTTKGRRTKLSNYLRLSKSFFGAIPHDLANFVRVADDLPDESRDELMAFLKSNNWQASFIPDPTLLRRLVRR
ncbi:MAG: 4Fe-4S dicluster domain-containing protein [Nitrospirota bacterium]